MKQVRIIRRTEVDNSIIYVIQQKHWLFRCWSDAWVNSWAGALCRDSFSSFKEAQSNLCYFNGTKIKEEIMIGDLK